MTEMVFVKTPDSDLATVLYCLGFPIDGIHYSGEGEKMEFYFKDNEHIRRAMLDYSLRKLRMEPRELLDTRKEIIAKVKNEWKKESLRKS